MSTTNLKSLKPSFSPYIAESTDRWRLDKNDDHYQLINKRLDRGNTIFFDGKDAVALENAFAQDHRNYPNSALNARFARVWKRFHKFAK